jgi:hypothetical protein
MKPQPTTASTCSSVAEVDAWAMRAFVTRAIPDLPLARHLLACARCRRRAAIAWALLPEPACATMPPIPQPNLSFLKPVSADR